MFTTSEVVALFDLDEGRVRKDVEHGVLSRSQPPRFDFASVVYLRTMAQLGIELGIDDRKRLHALVLAAVKTMHPTIALSPICEVHLAEIMRDVTVKLRRFTAWKERLVTDARILAGEPVFPRSRLAVRQIGDMHLRGASVAELREDYPYLKDEDIELAALYVRAYPRMGRPRGGQAPAR